MRTALLAALLTSTTLALQAPPSTPTPPATPATPGHHGHDHHGHDHANANDLNGLLERTAEFSTLVALLKQADLTETLEHTPDGGVTLFAPTNDAFAKLPEATLDALTHPDNKPKLRALLLAHVVKGTLTPATLKEGDLPTLADTKIKITLKDAKPLIAGHPLTHPHLPADNGTLIPVDHVLLPQ